MALTNQIRLYGVDTKAFYFEDEFLIQKKMSATNKIIGELNEQINKIMKAKEKEFIDNYISKDISKVAKKKKKKKAKFKFAIVKKNLANNIQRKEENRVQEEIEGFEEVIELKEQISPLNKQIAEYKNELYGLFEKNKHKQREMKFENYIVRDIDYNSEEVKYTREEHVQRIKDSMTDSLFESCLTRTMGLQKDELTENIMIIGIFYQQIMDSIIEHGYTYKGNEYEFFTASAGQIRNKKIVCVRKDIIEPLKPRLTCGLTIKDINKKGGMNVNKYLAYNSLSNSSTDEWKEFDISKCIVVDDMEVMVKTKVDYIDYKTYEIEEGKDMEVPIPHMDGCGIILPELSKTNFMFRMPWFKGLLAVGDFKTWILEKRIELNDASIGIIKDIYGKEYDVIKDDIKIIFTKSQFKLAKYYDSWEQYQNNFIKYNCQACKCNDEKDVNFKKTSKLNYQMLQTLVDIKDDEINKILKNTNEKIEKLGNDIPTMIKALGAEEDKEGRNWFQKALSVDKSLIRDVYSKEVIRSLRNSIIKQAKAGSFDVDCKFTFIIPDFIAFFEWLFLNEEHPKGLLNKMEVSCKLYKTKKELDCLRSPHLFMEHAVRNNVFNEEIEKWFTTNGLYVSANDVISKILQFDVDGDRSNVCADKTIIKVAKRIIKNNNIYPLYYEMKKADPVIINHYSMSEGIKSAFNHGNIGIYSNNISKIWNSEDILVKENGVEKINPIALKTIKLLCMENNFCIDAAKTLFMPTRPKEMDEMIKRYTKLKLPSFFMYAKDKDFSQISEPTNSFMCRLENMVYDKEMIFSKKLFGNFEWENLCKKAYKSLPNNGNEIISLYKENDLKSRNFIDEKVDNAKTKQLLYKYRLIREDLLNKFNGDINLILNCLCYYLYEKENSLYKTTLWECFGEEMYNNLKANLNAKKINSKIKHCERCGCEIEVTTFKKYCSECAKEIEKEKIKIRVARYRELQKM